MGAGLILALGATLLQAAGCGGEPEGPDDGSGEDLGEAKQAVAGDVCWMFEGLDGYNRNTQGMFCGQTGNWGPQPIYWAPYLYQPFVNGHYAYHLWGTTAQWMGSVSTLEARDAVMAARGGTWLGGTCASCLSTCPAAAPYRWASNGNCYKCPEGQTWLDNGQGTAGCQNRCAGLTGTALAECNKCDVSGGVACRCDQLKGEAKDLCFCSAFGGGAACFNCPPDQSRGADGTCSPNNKCDEGNNPTVDECGKIIDDGKCAGDQNGKVGNPFDLGTQSKSETVSCLKLPEGRGARVGVGIFWSSALWERGEGDTDLGSGWTTGHGSRIEVGGGVGQITRTIKVRGEGSADFYYNATAASGPYYPAYMAESLSPSWLNEEKSGGTVTGYLVTQRDGHKTHYKADGSLDWVKDDLGNQTTITLENGGNLKRIKNETTGQSVELVYGIPVGGFASRRLLELRDAASNRPAGSSEPLRSVTLSYDTQGHVTRVNEDFGQGNVAERSYDYDAQGRPYRIYNANNGPGASPRKYTQTIYNGATGRVTGQIAPNGITTAVNRVTQTSWNYEVVTSDGSETHTQRFLVDDSGIVTRKYEMDSTVAFTAYTYDMSGLLATMIDPTGRTVDYESDRRLRKPTKIIEAKGTADAATTQMFYDAAGRLTKSIDPFGRVQELVYCTSVSSTCGVVGALQSLTDKGLNGTATPRITTYETNVYGQAQAIVAPDGTRTTTTYDARGLPATVAVDPTGLNLVTSTQYDWRGYLRQQTEPRGIVTTYEVNGRGWPTALIVDSAAGGKQIRTELAYDNLGHATQVKEDVGGLNRTTQTVYDFVGSEATYQAVQLREAVGTADARTTTFSFDVLGEPTQVTKPYLGAGSAMPTLVSTFTYQRDHGGAGSLVSAYENGALITATHHDMAGRVIAVTDGVGVKTTRSYTGRGQVAQEVVGAQAVGSSAAVNATTTYTYFADGTASTITRPGGATTTHAYDAYGRLTTRTESGPDFTSRWTKSTHDVMDRVTSAEQGTGATTVLRADTTYDRAGRKLSEAADPAGLNLITTYAYTDTIDPADKVNRRRVTDANGNATRHRYDSLGNLVESIDPANTSFTFSHDDLGRLVTQAGAGRSQSFGYDLLDRKVSATSALGTESWVYFPGGALRFYCPVAGQSGACDATNAETVKYTFTTAANESVHLLGIDYPEVSGVQSPDATYTYRASDQLATVDDTDGQTAYTYDALGRVLTKTRTPRDADGSLLSAEARTITHAYKANDLPLASIQYWNRGSVLSTTNSLHEVTGLTDWSGNTNQYGYSTTGQLASASVNSGDAFAAAYSYDTAGRRSRVQRTKAGSNVLDLQYAPSGLPGRDANGNIRSIREAWQGETTLDTQYLYDNRDRLSKAQYPALPGGTWGAGVQGARDYDYLQDAAGNLTTINNVTTFAHDTADRLTTAGYTQDADGNLLRRGSDKLSGNPAPNLLVNASFEGDLSSWSDMSSSSWSWWAGSVSSPAAFGGSSAAIHHGPDGSWGTQITQSFPEAVTAGDVYSMTAWARGDSGNEWLFMSAQTTEGDWAQWQCTGQRLTTEWTRYGCLLPVPAALDGRVPEVVLRNDTYNGTIYVDSVEIQRAPVALNLLNLGFEEGLSGWGYYSAASGYVAATTTSMAYSGSSALALTHGNDGWGTQMDQATASVVPTDGTYQLSVMTRGIAGGEWFGLLLKDAETNEDLDAVFNASTTSWEKTTMTVPSTANGHRIRIVLMSLSEGGTILFDDLALETL